MKIEYQRFIDSFFGRLICRLLDIFHILTKKGKIRVAPKKICVILLSEMGSITLTWPMIHRLKEKYPDSEIFILTFQRNIEIIKILNLVPDKNILTMNDQTFFSIISEALKVLWVMRKLKVNTVIDCELFSRISSIFSFLSGAGTRVGFHPHTQEGLFRGNHINGPVLYNPHLHIAHQFINLAEAIESYHFPLNKRIPSDDELINPEFCIESHEQKQIVERIHRIFPSNAASLLSRPLVILNPGAGLLPIRAWPIDYYTKVAYGLLEAGFSIAVTGLKEDSALGETITGFCQSDFCVNFTGWTRDIKEFLVLLSISSLLITNDGGPGHFAALTSTPSIVLFGPETPVLYGCLNPNGVNMYAKCACSPCLSAYNHRNSPCDGDNVCLKSILPDEVISKSLEFF